SSPGADWPAASHGVTTSTHRGRGLRGIEHCCPSPSLYHRSYFCSLLSSPTPLCCRNKMGLFDSFKAKTPAEQLRENKRMLDRAVRELDRERQKIEAQEKQTVANMKKAAKAGQQEACRMMAKDIVRQRAYVTKFYKMRAQLSSVSMQLQTLSSQQAMNKA